ncbi:DNA primase [Thermoanaerobacterium thermosaccharolyticum]|uniref:DNA primase n=1 Tax=Thermoanaerobacterium thermosaccharolyticum TaxID=1517 RepID=A0A223HZZ1_THETR|nr:CHC2 zinc finger domain-containing protein [Thermoanaerobacterium thermosaccharolyticum]AST58009.1 DNA primase [Thermoanaerobacterium thermosaccharolyticum]
MNINEIIEIKIKYEMGQLYNYLNEIENTYISSQITGENLVKFYNLNATNQYGHWRCVCPFHQGASNKTEFIFNDNEKSFTCFACKTSGTYLKFIALMQGFTSNALNEAKIFAAINFAHLNLTFNSISDYKEKIKRKVLKRYEATKSLNIKDYYDISILPRESSPQVNTVASKPDNSSVINEDKSSIEPSLKKNTELNIYTQAIEDAKNSILLHEILLNKEQFNSIDKLQDFMQKKYYISGDIIEKYGLIYFDRQSQSKLTHSNFYGLSDRVIFPFKDHKSGIVVGFHCRLVSYNKKGEEKSKQRAKYLNIVDYGELKTKDNRYQYYGLKSFSIGQFLFNLFEIKDNKVTKLWITEGVADCLKLISLGYINAVSPGQSNLTDEQINLLKDYFGCEIEVLLFFDNDNNNIGQCNSIQIAYKLWNSGFRNIKIVRTFPGQGKDLTDVAVAIQNDSQLQMLIDLWEKNAYVFSPASEEHLNVLLNSGYYTDSEVFSIDPRDIEEEIAKVKLLKKLGHQTDFDIKELKKIKNITSIVESNINISKDNTNSNIFEPASTTHITSPSRNEVELCKTDSSQNPECCFMNISDAQLYRLKQKFDKDTIKEIDEKCTREQIINMVGKIIGGIPFKLDEYLFPEKYSPSVLVDENFNPIIIEPEDIPF